MSDDQPDTMHSVLELAEYANVSPMVIWGHIKSGELPAYRFGKKAYRVRLSDWLAFLERRRVVP